MAAGWLYERAWGKPKEFDESKEKSKTGFDPSLYSLDQLSKIEAALRIIIAVRDGTAIEDEG